MEGGHRHRHRLQADKLLFLTEVAGVHEDPLDSDSPIDTEMALADARRLPNPCPRPNAPEDLAFYPQHCVKACRVGRRALAHPAVCRGRRDPARRSSRMTASAPWWSTKSSKAFARRAPDDVGGILQLRSRPFERDGTLVRRERTEIERDIGCYTVIEHDGVIFGCATALYPYPRPAAEMAALTVSPHVQGQATARTNALSSVPGPGAWTAFSS